MLNADIKRFLALGLVYFGGFIFLKERSESVRQ
jgi:hypothetical protein